MQNTNCNGKNVKKELDHMVEKKVIAPVSEPTEWVSQMVATQKKNGETRICLDPRNLNLALKRSHYPMRTVESVAAHMAGLLSGRSGFCQITLDKKSSMLTTFGTPFGRFRYL